VGQNVLGGWHFNVLARWTAGWWSTWNPNNVPGIVYNVQWRDWYNVDLKVSKVFQFGKLDVKFFMDIFNLFNIKHFSNLSYRNSFDRNFYWKSLHLPEDIGDRLGYPYIPGDDRPGDYRKEGVEYVPMEAVPNVEGVTNPSTSAVYYETETKNYMQYSDGQWSSVPQSRIDQILEDKAYIDMPNQDHFTFLNPRSIFFGLTVNFRL
jgi:hypothetical protein